MIRRQITSERVDRYQHRAYVRVNFPVCPALLQVVVDAFVTDCRQQGHIRHSNLFLLKSFFPVRLSQINDCIKKEDKCVPSQPWPSPLLSSQQVSPFSLPSWMEPGNMSIGSNKHVCEICHTIRLSSRSN